MEGAKNVQELINSDYKIEFLVGSESFISQNLKSGSHRNEIVKPDLLEQLGTFKTNEDAIAVARMKEWNGHQINFDDHIFLLDGVGDPGNVGTIIRTLDWFGFDQVVCSEGCAEFYHPKVINSTMGSFTRMKVFNVDISEFYSQNNLPVFAADMSGKSIKDFKPEHPVVIVLGSESHGVGDTTRKNISDYLSIPKFGNAESLNVGIATGILAAHFRMS
nr:RNA methyltransferase [Ekhidna lutea]